eukprot:9365701-Pyramimonas_sp.AAC.1
MDQSDAGRVGIFSPVENGRQLVVRAQQSVARLVVAGERGRKQAQLRHSHAHPREHRLRGTHQRVSCSFGKRARHLKRWLVRRG